MESFSTGNNRAKQDRFLRELDAWVAEEADALGAPPRSKEQQPPATEGEPASSAVIDARDHWPEQRRESARSVSNDSLSGLFETDEEELIEQIIGLIGERPNADTILDEIWRRVTGALSESEDVVVPLSPIMVEDNEAGDDFDEAPSEDETDAGPVQDLGPDSEPDDV